MKTPKYLAPISILFLGLLGLKAVQANNDTADYFECAPGMPSAGGRNKRTITQ